MKTNYKQLVEVLVAGFVGLLVITGLLYFFKQYLASVGIAFLSGGCLAVAGSLFYFSDFFRMKDKLTDVQKSLQREKRLKNKAFMKNKKEGRRGLDY
jgi:hypothetical protein